MKKFLFILSIIAFFTSCKENVVNDFDSKSVKENIVKALNNTEWVAKNPSNSYYSKIVFGPTVITVTLSSNGAVSNVGYDVTNVFGPEAQRPDSYQLRLKSGLALNEIYVAQDFQSIESVVYDRSIDNKENYLSMEYNKVK